MKYLIALGCFLLAFVSLWVGCWVMSLYSGQWQVFPCLFTMTGLIAGGLVGGLFALVEM